jgi:hypothetical protein
MDLSDTDYAYAAGFIDADGTISCSPDRCGPRLSISAYNNDSRPLNLLAHLFGGKVMPVSRKTRRPGHAPEYVWRCPARYRAELCQKLLPYLRRKREHAAAALRFLTATDGARDEAAGMIKALNSQHALITG